MMKILYLFGFFVVSIDAYPMEMGGNYQGDIVLTPDQLQRGIGKQNPFARWPNGIIPYEISSEFDGYDQGKILSGIRRLERIISLDSTFCIRFRPRHSNDQYFLSIRNGTGCSSYVGRLIEGGQIITLQTKFYCVDREATIMHELIHALGFWHEQSRPDRDDYITIHYDNIQFDREHNFDKHSASLTDTLGLPYDYHSVMHYPNTAFSKNGLPTITTRDPHVWIGQRNTLSAIDIQEIRKYYNCA